MAKDVYHVSYKVEVSFCPVYWDTELISGDGVWEES